MWHSHRIVQRMTLCLLVFNFAIVYAFNNCSYGPVMKRYSENICDEGDDYYCIQVSANETFLERCLPVLNIPENIKGCPWLLVQGGSILLGRPFTSCDPSVQGCPPAVHPPYTTNMLSKYPLCLQPLKNRHSLWKTTTYNAATSSPTIEIRINRTTKQVFSLSNGEPKYAEGSDGGWQIAFIALLAVVLVVVFLFALIVIIKRVKRRRNAPGQKNATAKQDKWTHNETLLLMDLYVENKHDFENPALKKNQVWKAIARGKQGKGSGNRNWEICEKKWRNMKTRYRSIKDNNKMTGRGKVSWVYFDRMNEICGNDPAVTPVKTCSSMSITDEITDEESDVHEMLVNSREKHDNSDYLDDAPNPTQHIEDGGVFEAKFRINGEKLEKDTFLETELTKEIWKTLVNEGSRELLLYGESGFGKTHSAKWYAMKVQNSDREKDWRAWMVDCLDKNSVFQTMNRIGEKMEIFCPRKLQGIEEDIMKIAKDVASTMVQPRRDDNKLFHHVVIFDQVPTEQEDFSRNLVGLFVNQSNIQCIITSTKNLTKIFTSFKPIEVKGFSIEESVLFLKGFGQKDELEKLANFLNKSPFALKVAKQYMEDYKISATYFWSCMTESVLDEVFFSFRTVFENIEKSEPQVFDLMRSISFLNPNKIPIDMLLFIKSELPYKDANHLANRCLRTIEKYQLGYVDGRDDKRMLTVRDSLRPLFRLHNGDQTKDETVILTLMKSFCWLFKKNPCHATDLHRNILLLQHAEKLLDHEDKYKLLENPTVDIFLAYLITCDRICFTYRHLGYATKSRELSKCAVKFAFDFLASDIHRTFKTSFATMNDSLRMETCKKIVESSWEKMLERESEITKGFGKEYVLNTHRGIFLTGRLESLLKRKLNKKVQLTVEEYDLLAKEVAVLTPQNDDILNLILFCEAVSSTSVTYGLQKSDNLMTEDKEQQQYYVDIAYYIAQLLREHLKTRSINPYLAVDVDLNGKIELLLAKDTKDSEHIELLKSSERRIKEYLKQNEDYFSLDLMVVSPKDLNFRLQCNSQILRIHEAPINCYSEKAEAEQERTEQDLSKQAQVVRKLLKDGGVFEAPSSQLVKLTLARHFLKTNQFQSANDLLEDVQHFDPMSPNYPLTKHDIRDLKLLCNCYDELKEYSKVERMVNIIKDLRGNIPPENIDAQYELNKLQSYAMGRIKGQAAASHLPF